MTDDLRELDRRCASAMGWRTDGAAMWQPIALAEAKVLPRYSTSIAAAWLLVKYALQEHGLSLDLYVDDNGARALFVKVGFIGTVCDAPEAAEAISSAFLAAMEARVTENAVSP